MIQFKRITDNSAKITVQDYVEAEITVNVSEIIAEIPTDDLQQELDKRKLRIPTESKKTYEKLRSMFNMSHFEDKKDLKHAIDDFIENLNEY